MPSVLSKFNIELESKNFEFMKLDIDLAELYKHTVQAELDYALQNYDNSKVTIRKISEKVVDLVLDQYYEVVPEGLSLNKRLSILKKYNIPERIMEYFYEIKGTGNLGAHEFVDDAQKTSRAIQILRFILIWYMNEFSGEKIQKTKFVHPRVVQRYANNQERKLIYIQTADDSSGEWQQYTGAEKIGETTAPADDMEVDWSPNSEFLREATKRRLKGYMTTAGVPFKIQWSELAWIKTAKRWFGDADVHEVLHRSGIKHKEGLEGNEWFEVDLETAKAAIKAVKDGRKSLKLDNKESTPKITLRNEQNEAVKMATRAFKRHQKVLWNAKMRFGKTLSTYELIKQNGYKKVLVMTHRPVVSDSWFDDFKKIEMAEAGYEYGSKDMGEKEVIKLLKEDRPFIYFASIQDLRGSEKVGGKFAKNSEFFDTPWDLIVVDEAHEGTKTERGDKLYEELTKPETKILELSGTPFNILADFSEEQVFTWDYIMEQQAKIRFSMEHPNEVNPYETLPEVEMYTFEMATDKKYQNADKYFDFAEFFKVDDNGEFIHATSIKKWLNQISNDDEKSSYPFSTEEYRESIRHTMWLLPSRASAKALKKLLENHQVFKQYSVLNIVDDNDDEDANEADMERVRAVMTEKPSETKTIILTVRKLTTGVNIKPLNAVVFLNNTTSAQNYLQAAFRAQTPYSDEVLGMKKKAYIFDFAPDRALNVLAKSVSMSPKAGALNTDEQKEKLRTLLNFLPVLEQSGHEMKPYSISSMMRQLKKAYAEKAVMSGFDDTSIYNDELWKATEEDAKLFNELGKKLAKTSQTKKPKKIVITDNGLDEEQKAAAKRGRRKPKKERTPEEEAALEAEKARRKERGNMIAILRGVSIRIPLMIYGMDMDLDKDIRLDDFLDRVDDVSWKEFMPKDITKEDFKSFRKFYDPEVFIEAGHRIRQAALSANNLSYQDRVEKITSMFAGFKNPDKETVLTPWRVVNMQLGMTLGGCNFFDEEYKEPLDDGKYREIHLGKVTDEVFDKNSKILDINSKTGLYPLYMAFGIYQKRYLDESGDWSKADFVDKDKALWQEVLENNIYVINKTPMARTITYRTLNGYELNTKVERNLIYIEDLASKLKADLDKTKKEVLAKFGGGNLKFDAVVGNPPYQIESIGDNNSDTSIYCHFYDMAEVLSTKYCLISPARFLSNAGNTSKDWNKKMLNDEHLKVVHFEQKSANVFPNTDIKGGVAVLYRDEEKDFGAIGVFTSFEEQRTILEKVGQKTTLTLDTVMSNRGQYRYSEKIYKEFPEEMKRTSDKRIAPSAFDRFPEFFTDEKPQTEFEYMQIVGRVGNDRVRKWYRTDYLSAPESLYKYKVIVPKANGSGAIGEVLSTPLIGEPLIGEPLIGFTETFISIGAFESENEATNCMKYIKSKFARTMLGMLKTTQNNPKETWAKVPLQDFTPNSDINWSATIPEIDQQLYAKYGLDEKEIRFIEEKVKGME